MIFLNYGAYWLQEVWTLEFQQSVFKKVTSAGLNSLRQKEYQISVKNWIFYEPFNKKGPVLVILVPGMIQPSAGRALGISICGCSLFYKRELWASKSASAHSTFSLKISGCKRWCLKDLRVRALTATVLTHSLDVTVYQCTYKKLQCSIPFLIKYAYLGQ